MRFKNLLNDISAIKNSNDSLVSNNADLTTQLQLNKEVDYRLLAKQLDAVNHELKQKDAIKVEVEGRNSTLQSQVDELRFQLESMGDNQDQMKNTKKDLEDKVNKLTNKLHSEQQVGKDAINLAFELRTYLKNKPQSYKDITRIHPATWTNIKKDLEGIFKLVRLKEDYRKKRDTQISNYRRAMMKSQSLSEQLRKEIIELKEKFEKNNVEDIRERLRSYLRKIKTHFLGEKPDTTGWIDLGEFKYFGSGGSNETLVSVKVEKVQKTLRDKTEEISWINFYKLSDIDGKIFKDLEIGKIKTFRVVIQNEIRNEIRNGSNLDPSMFMISLTANYRIDINENDYDDKNDILPTTLRTIESSDVEDYDSFNKEYGLKDLEPSDIEHPEFAPINGLERISEWYDFRDLVEKWRKLNEAGGLNDKEKKILALVKGITKEDTSDYDMMNACDKIKKLLTTDDYSDTPNLKSLPSIFVSTFDNYYKNKKEFEKSQKTVANLEHELEYKATKEKLLEDNVDFLKQKEQDTRDLLQSANDEKSEVEAKRLALVETTTKLERETAEKTALVKEKQEEIDGLHKKVGEIEGDKKSLKEELDKLATELEKNKNSAEVSSSNIYGRSWEGFFDYLTTYVFDWERAKKDRKNISKLTIRPDKYYVKDRWKNKLEKKLLEREILYNFIANIEIKNGVKSYNDNEKATMLCLTPITLSLSSQMSDNSLRNEFNKLLDGYRIDTNFTAVIAVKDRDWFNFFKWIKEQAFVENFNVNNFKIKEQAFVGKYPNILWSEKNNTYGFFYYFCLSLIKTIKMQLPSYENISAVNILPNYEDSLRFDEINLKQNVFGTEDGKITRVLEWNDPEKKKKLVEDADKMLSEWKESIPLAPETPQAPKPTTTSNLVWNDFYWWINNNIAVPIVGDKDRDLVFENKEEEIYPNSKDRNSVRLLLQLMGMFTNQEGNFVDYEEEKNFVDLLKPNDIKYSFYDRFKKNKTNETEEYVKYFNNLLNRYRKTVTFVEYKRGWGDFYEWLQVNITKDKNKKVEEIEIKDELKKDYPFLSESSSNGKGGKISLYSSFLQTISKSFLPSISLTEFGKINPYEENKTIFQLINLKSETLTKYLEDGGKLLDKYRQETKVLKKQILANVPVGVVKARSWESFRDWLNANIIDKSQFEWVKPETREKYGLTYLGNEKHPDGKIGILENVIEAIEKPLSVKYPLNSYSESGKFSEITRNAYNFALGNISLTAVPEVVSDMNVLFENFKKDTPIQTISGQELTNEEKRSLELISKSSLLNSTESNINNLKQSKKELEAFIEKKDVSLPLIGSYVEQYTKSIDGWIKSAEDSNKKSSSSVAGTKIAIEKIMEKSWQGFYDWLIEKKLDREGEGFTTTTTTTYTLKTPNDKISQKALSRFMVSLESTIADKSKKINKAVKEFDASQWIKIGTFEFVKKGDGVNNVIITPKEVELTGFVGQGNKYSELLQVEQITYINSIDELDNGRTKIFELWFNATKQTVKDYVVYSYVSSKKKLLLSQYNCDVRVISEITDFHIFPNFDKNLIFQDYFPFMRGVYWGDLANKVRIGISSYNVVEEWFDEWKTFIPASSEEEKGIIKAIENILDGLDRINYADFNPLLQEEGYIGDANQKTFVNKLKQDISDLKDKTSSNSFLNLGSFATIFPNVAEHFISNKEEIWKKEKEQEEYIKSLKDQIDNFYENNRENSDSLKSLEIYRTSRILSFEEEQYQIGDSTTGLVSYGRIRREDIFKLLENHAVHNLKYLGLKLTLVDEYNQPILKLNDIPNFSTKTLEIWGHVNYLRRIVWPTLMERNLANNSVLSNVTIYNTPFPHFPGIHNDSRLYYGKYYIKDVNKGGGWTDKGLYLGERLVNINLGFAPNKQQYESSGSGDSSTFPTIEKVE